ncbi:MAG: hypothetical protein Q7R85_02510, partial [bacterium]|nr:hypothetical protein [bacterium]
MTLAHEGFLSFRTPCFVGMVSTRLDGSLSEGSLMNRPEITIGQGLELLALARRLTPDEYQARHRWLVNVTNPEFNIAALEQCLTPTTFGSEIKPPFEDEGGWDIIADGPGDDLLDVANIQQLPMLNEGE